MRRLSFSFDDQIVNASQGETILEAVLAADLELDHSCGGGASCGTCRVFVEQGLEKLAPRNELELEMADERLFLKNERLACQTLAVEGIKLRRPSRV